MAKKYECTGTTTLIEALTKFAELNEEYEDVELVKGNVEGLTYYIIRYR